MSETQKSRHLFHFNAHAHGLSAHFERPVEHLLEAQAGTSLPIIGGHGNSRVENFRFKEIVSFKSAYTHVSGNHNEEDNSHETLVTSVVEHLNVLDVVTADRIVARLSSRHPHGKDEPHIVPLGSKFENLRIAGCPVEVELDTGLFCDCDTYSAFKKQFETDKKFREMVEARFLWGKLAKDVPEFVRQRYNWAGRKGLPESHGVALCSLVKNMDAPCPGVKKYGHILVVPQFGRVFLGELLLEHSQRTLSMIRVEFGCSVSGNLIGAQTSINGRPWP